jgi:hypothetical protein
MGNYIAYYPTYNYSSNRTNLITINNIIIENINGITQWKIVRSANGAPLIR